MKYVAYLTNPGETRGPLSFSGGGYGFTLTADSLDDAITKAVTRARADGIYGEDWSVLLRRADLPLSHELGAHEAQVALRDDLDCPAFAHLRQCNYVVKLAAGGLLI